MKANLLGTEKGLTGTYNVGTGKETDVNTLFRHLAEITGFAGEEVHGPPMAGEQARSCLDASLLGRNCGWNPSTDIREGLEKTVGWFRERADVT